MKNSKNEMRDSKKFTLRMQKKLVVLFVIVLLAFVALTIRLMYINKESGEKYKRQVLSQQKYDSKSLPFKRGDITDRKGSRLAYSEKVYNLVVDAKMMKSEEGIYLEPTLKALGECFEVNVEEIRKYVEENPDSQYKIFAKQLKYDTISPFVELQNESKASKEKEDIQGVWFEETYVREYPYNTLACDVLGFTQGEDTGYFGLEEFYNSILNGTNGREYGYLNEDSSLERTIKSPVDGNTIVTTLDTNIQSIVEKHIVDFNEKYKNGAREGNGSTNLGVIIMDPNSGEILAMAGYPVFNLNNPSDLAGVVTPEVLAGMTEEQKAEARNQLWRNFCISDTFEPGSTMKPFTVAMALESGSITGNETYNCTGVLEYGEHKIHCHNRLGDGIISVQQAIMKSCNVALMHIGEAVGRETWLKYNRAFNFGLKTNVDLSGEARTDSVVFDESMGVTDLAVSTFGQGFNVTMIQMAAGFSSLINGGYYYQPHLVKKILNSEGSVVEEVKPRILKQTISNITSDKMIEMCNTVVMNEEGTGRTARPAGYTMGGKTGTAEKKQRDKINYVVSFMGYAPMEDPQVLIYVVIDEPNVTYQDDAKFATILSRDIMTEVLPYMNIFMTEPLTDKEKEELKEQQAQFGVSSNYVSGNGVSGNSVSQNGTKDKTVSANSLENGENQSTSQNAVKQEIKYDEETGYPIDPNTGEILDPNTLKPIDGTGSYMD